MRRQNAKDRPLDVLFLGCGLDDEVAVGEVRIIRAGDDPSERTALLGAVVMVPLPTWRSRFLPMTAIAAVKSVLLHVQ